jgi:hypothetical protein
VNRKTMIFLIVVILPPFDVDKAFIAGSIDNMRADDRIEQDEPGRLGYSKSGLGQYSSGKSWPEPFSPIPEPDRDDPDYVEHRGRVDARIARSTTPNIIV